MTRLDATALLPLRPNWFHILLTLAEEPHHGYAIMQEVAQRTDGKIRIWPATLYGTIRKLEHEGLVEPVDVDVADDDERRQYYDITRFGRRVLSAEVKRLEALVQLARLKGVAHV
jgi:DNA-binding PadR family transcriptional regulator